MTKSSTWRLGILAVLSALATLAPATAAQAAPTYWTFRNVEWNHCLTAGASDRAYLSSCTGYWDQQWDWVGGNGMYKQLKNRDTQRCLMTDYASDNTNAVWMSTCDARAIGQQYYFQSSSDTIMVNSRTNNRYLRSSPREHAVYSESDYWSWSRYATWVGTHS